MNIENLVSEIAPLPNMVNVDYGVFQKVYNTVDQLREDLILVSRTYTAEKIKEENGKAYIRFTYKGGLEK